jgi:CHAT domain-containing protein
VGQVTEQSEHLSSAQIENYGNRTSGAGPEAAQRDEHQRANHQSSDDKSLFDQQSDQQITDQSATDQRVEAHLADCASCRNRVLDFHRHRFALLSGPAPDAKPTDSALADSNSANPKYPAGPQVRTAATPECPSDDALRQLAAGLTPDALAAQLTQHAATCDHCGPLLGTFTEDFSDDFSPEEQAALANLKSSSTKWQKTTAQKMLEASGVQPAPAPATDEKLATQKSSTNLTGEPKPFFWKWVLVPAIAAVIVLAAITFPVYLARRDAPEKAEGLLAQAYTDQRTMEMRWPGAKWARADMTRGPSDSAFSEPRALVDAKQIIMGHSTKADDLKWFRVRAETEILENHPEKAIELLEPAESTEQVPVLLDLAIAHSQLARSSDEPLKKQKVVDLLLRAVKKEPRNPTALFNLAIAYEKVNDWGTAVQAWDEYLKAYPEGKWADEARQKREAAQKKTQFSLEYPASPSHDVASFLALSEDKAAFQFEQYQDIALRYWLFEAIARPESPERQAIVRVGQISERISGDPWWSDLLSATAGTDPSGAQALSTAFSENEKGHYGEAGAQALQAVNTFSQQQNPASELRAEYELVYAERRSLTGKECEVRAGPLQARVVRTRYYRLQSLLDTEIALCLNYVGKLKESEVTLLHSLQIAQNSHLPIAVLRNMAFSQSLHDLQRDYEPAMRDGIEGLRQYWDGPPCNERLYQFYAVFSRTAKKNGLLAASEAFMQRGVEILKTGDDNIQKAAALQELSNILVEEKENDAADRAARQANEFYDLDIKEPTSRKYSLAGKIGLAEWQLQRDKPRGALATLRPVRGLLAETDGYFISLDFHRLSGNAHLALRQWNEASSAYQSAILIAEQDLSELKNDEERLDWVKKSDDAYRGLVRVLLEQRATEDAWKLWEWYISRSHPENVLHAAHKQPYKDWSGLWAEISTIEKPSDGPVRMIYAVFEDGVQVWTASSSQLTPRWIPVERKELEEKAQQFSQACARKNSPLPEIQTLGQVLFAWLVQPMEGELPSTQQLLAIETDRTLSDVPLEALRSREGWYLGEKYSVIYSPGVLYEQELRRSAKMSSRTPFLLVDASTGGYFPGREKELLAIQRAFVKTNVLGAEADPAKIQAGLVHSAIFGFMGHGESNGAGAGLRMNPKLILKAQHFPPRTLRSLQLAVLAACSTGSSSADGLLDNRSLVHAFLAGGTPSVVASRWNVDSAATADLISDFYSRLNRESAPQALLHARNQLLKTHSHPYYWAGFSVTGKVN